MAAIDAAGGTEEMKSGGDIQVDEVEIINFGGANAAGCAVNDRIRLKTFYALRKPQGIRHVDLFDGYIWKTSEEVKIYGAHQDVKTRLGVFDAELLHDVISESAGSASNENSMQMGSEHSC
jgi:hypothetical protein